MGICKSRVSETHSLKLLEAAKDGDIEYFQKIFQLEENNKKRSISQMPSQAPKPSKSSRSKSSKMEDFSDQSDIEEEELTEAYLSKLIKVKDKRNKTVLHFAARDGNHILTQYICELYKRYGLSVDLKDKYGTTPAILCCVLSSSKNEDQNLNSKKEQDKRSETLKVLLASGSNWAVTDYKDYNPLHWAMFNGNTKLCIYLMQNRPEFFYMKNSEGDYPMNIPLNKIKDKDSLDNARSCLLTIINRFLKTKNELEGLEKRLADQKAKILSEIEKSNRINKRVQSQSSKKFKSKLDELEKMETAINQTIIVNDMNDEFKSAFAAICIWLDEHKSTFKKFETVVNEISVEQLFAGNHLKDNSLILAGKKGLVEHTEIIINKLKQPITPDESSQQIKERVRKYINLPSEHEMNTALHHCCHFINQQTKRSDAILEFEPNYLKVGKCLLEEGADWNIFNYRGWRPIDYFLKNLPYCRELLRIIKEKEEQNTSKEIAGDEHKANAKGINFSLENLNNFNFPFQYCIIAKADSDNAYESIIYKQLLNIKKAHRREYASSHIEVVVYPGLELGATKCFFYLIYIPEEIVMDYSYRLGLNIFNISGGYHDKFSLENKTEYEPLRDYYLQRIIYFILESEFDVMYYKKEGIIVDNFPLHEFNKKKIIKDYWNHEKSLLWRHPFTLGLNLSELRPFNAIALYHGVKIGLYFGFFAHYTSWLVLPAILGVATFIIGIFFRDTIYPIAINFYCFFISFWVFRLVSKWTQKESKMAYLWSMHEFEETERVRDDYKGYYKVEPISKEVIKYNVFSTFYRRLSIEWIIILIAVGLIVSSFLALTFATESINNYYEDGTFSYNIKRLASIGVGVVNGIVILVLNMVYERLTIWVVDWENHLYVTTMESSLVLKNFVFQFFNTFVFLFYYTLIKPDFVVVTSSILSTFISKCSVNLVKQHLVPLGIYYFQKKILVIMWNSYMEKMKVDKVVEDIDLSSTDNYGKKITDNYKYSSSSDEGDLDGSDLDSHDSEQKKSKINVDTQTQLKLKQHSEGLTNASHTIYNLYKRESRKKVSIIPSYKKALYLQQQVELTRTMQVAKDLRFDYTYLAIQFGFLTIFACAFPLGPALAFVFNYIDIWLFTDTVTYYKKRVNSEFAERIGIWTQIFDTMGLIALIMNPLILYINTEKGFDFFFETESKRRYFTILFVCELAILFLRAMSTKLAGSKDNWVETQLQIEDYNRRSAQIRAMMKDNGRDSRKGGHQENASRSNMLYSVGTFTHL